MRRLRVALLSVVLFSLPVLAQANKAELFGGYSLEMIAPGCGSNYTCGGIDDLGAFSSLNGWTAAGTVYVYKSLGLSAQISGNYKSISPSFVSVHRFAYQFGPVYTFRFRHVSTFTHVLFGGVRQTGVPPGSSFNASLDYTKFMWSVGGGLDLGLSKRLSIRAIQIDYEGQQVPVNGFGTSTSSPTAYSSGLRYSTGLVLRF
ncbi:MAG: hypothetical protein ABSG72_09530 [Candidatus Sulfotelmatobacter sp.]|jgi:hypothetical protein